MQSETEFEAGEGRRRGVALAALLVAPPCAPVAVGLVCQVLARRAASEIGDIGWGFFGVPAAGVLALGVCALLAPRVTRTRAQEAWIFLVWIALGVAGWIAGWVLWFRAAEIACHGGYECPF